MNRWALARRTGTAPLKQKRNILGRTQLDTGQNGRQVWGWGRRGKRGKCTRIHDSPFICSSLEHMPVSTHAPTRVQLSRWIQNSRFTRQVDKHHVKWGLAGHQTPGRAKVQEPKGRAGARYSPSGKMKCLRGLKPSGFQALRKQPVSS